MGVKSSAETKAFVLQAFDTLFNRRDYAKAAEFWWRGYLQHSAHIAPGRDGLFNLVRSAPNTLRYENALIVAEGDYVMLHGRFTGNGRPRAWIAGDILRMEDSRPPSVGMSFRTKPSALHSKLHNIIGLASDSFSWGLAQRLTLAVTLLLQVMLNVEPRRSRRPDVRQQRFPPARTPIQP